MVSLPKQTVSSEVFELKGDRRLLASSFDCADEVPLHWVRGNQIGILISVVVWALTQQPWVLAVPLAVQLVGRTAGVKYNAFVRLLAPLLPASKKTESRELLRFNNLLAILFLAVALAALLAGMQTVAYVFLAMLTVAVVAALSGFCVGCFVYFHWKQFLARRRA